MSGRPRLVKVENELSGIRPPPPEDMSSAQKELWVLITNDEPVTQFATTVTRKLLADFCFHIEQAEIIKAEVAGFPVAESMRTSKGRNAYQQLLRFVDVHTRSAASIATKLRLTNQSRYTPFAAATASRNTLKGLKPWEI